MAPRLVIMFDTTRDLRKPPTSQALQWRIKYTLESGHLPVQQHRVSEASGLYEPAISASAQVLLIILARSPGICGPSSACPCAPGWQFPLSTCRAVLPILVPRPGRHSGPTCTQTIGSPGREQQNGISSTSQSSFFCYSPSPLTFAIPVAVSVVSVFDASVHPD